MLYEDRTNDTHDYVQDNLESVRDYSKEHHRCYECPGQNKCIVAFPLIGGHVYVYYVHHVYYVYYVYYIYVYYVDVYLAGSGERYDEDYDTHTQAYYIYVYYVDVHLAGSGECYDEDYDTHTQAY